MIPLVNGLKRKLAAGEAAFGFWITLEAPSLTEIANVLGLDWVCIDAEHGHLDYKEILEHIRATRGGTTTPLVRIAEIQSGLIKRLLDLGAAGIVVPQVSDPQDVERAIRFAKYPPRGVRGVGGERATLWGTRLRDATRAANDETMVIPMIESPEAGAQIDAILDVPGVDAIYFGPADFSAAAGHLGEWEGPGIAEQLLTIKDRIVRRSVPCGIMAPGGPTAKKRLEQGFRMISIGSDTGLVISGLSDTLAQLRPFMKSAVTT
jgi:2-keto-3-deoxy-L-rhamnonate aldolase RhmA